MNLEAPPWITDFPATLDFVFLVVFLEFGWCFFYFLTFPSFRVRRGSARCVMVCLLSRARLGMVFAFFILLTPPLSVGAGLGNRATHLWHRTHFQSCGLGLGGSWRIPCYFCSRFWYSLFAFPLLVFFALPPVESGIAMAFVDGLFLPLRARASFLSFLVLSYLFGFVASPFRGVGVGFEEPHLRLVFYT